MSTITTRNTLQGIKKTTDDYGPVAERKPITNTQPTHCEQLVTSTWIQILQQKKIIIMTSMRKVLKILLTNINSLKGTSNMSLELTAGFKYLWKNTTK